MIGSEGSFLVEVWAEKVRVGISYLDKYSVLISEAQEDVRRLRQALTDLEVELEVADCELVIKASESGKNDMVRKAELVKLRDSSQEYVVAFNALTTARFNLAAAQSKAEDSLRRYETSAHEARLMRALIDLQAAVWPRGIKNNQEEMIHDAAGPSTEY